MLLSPSQWVCSTMILAPVQCTNLTDAEKIQLLGLRELSLPDHHLKPFCGVDRLTVEALSPPPSRRIPITNCTRNYAHTNIISSSSIRDGHSLKHAKEEIRASRRGLYWLGSTDQGHESTTEGKQCDASTPAPLLYRGSLRIGGIVSSDTKPQIAR